MPIRVLLIDDHALFRSGIRLLLQRNEDFEVVAEAADGHEGVKRAHQLAPDVILLDLNMPGLSGLETLHLLQQEAPASAVVVLTVSEETDELTTALQSGARGYLLKNIDAEFLFDSVRRAARGEAVIAPGMTLKLVQQVQSQTPRAAIPIPADTPPAIDQAHKSPDKLTAREREIAAFLARGESNKMIARHLDLSESTVKIHV
ncbi:response regulator, partial [Burkholderiaceae bacterium DAT-1]|nr:response regulator [Burkholderiaceae bacterium DAT-1]